MMIDRAIASLTPMIVSHVVLSLPEVDALCTRAARGANYSWGISEECGRAVSWLAAERFEWAPVLLRRLNGPRGGGVVPKPKNWDSDGPVCALYAGTTLADFAALPEGPGRDRVEIGRVHDPLLSLPFVAQAATITGQTLSCYLDGTLWAHVSDQALHVLVPDMSNMTEALLAVEPCIMSAPLAVTSSQATSDITKQNYAALSAIALRMTVPATAESATRAGGTKSDND
ncbi:DUF3726 domain-containing protein [uncultured Roseibium sp.]|uniref:DUF3726 domain-containing protein n=1 Tax=uncultured Roseibium sp. TaxID=1936171 RepID=UPI00259299C5|nr:DUF3726 domain-containing protein [uncultured Roseibium sp.]